MKTYYDYGKKISERMWNQPDKGELEAEREQTFIDDIVQKAYIERELLDSFAKKAELGQIIEVKEIKAAYEEKVGHSTGGSQIYYVLARHGWRKIIPRSRHPKKASDEAIDASKKLTESSEKK